MANLKKLFSSFAALFNHPLKRLTSYKIGGKVACLLFPKNIDQLKEILSILKRNGLPFFILGDGTNLLLSDKGYAGVMISLKKFNQIKLSKKNSEILAQAGVKKKKLLNFTLHHSLSGAEFMTGIPGTIGGGIFMNAGTLRGDFSNILKEVTLLSPWGKIQTLSQDKINLNYRDKNIFKNKIILEAIFQLKKSSQTKISAKINRLDARRKKTQPLNFPSCGCVFKNPSYISAGRLIEQVGLKGKRIGGAEISSKHANFFINYNQAKAQDINRLIKLTKERVYQKFGIKLEEEVVKL